MTSPSWANGIVRWPRRRLRALRRDRHIDDHHGVDLTRLEQERRGMLELPGPPERSGRPGSGSRPRPGVWGRFAPKRAGELGQSQPVRLEASAARIPGPPALVTIPTRPPAGIGCRARRLAAAKSSSIVSTRMTPA